MGRELPEGAGLIGADDLYTRIESQYAGVGRFVGICSPQGVMCHVIKYSTPD